MIITSPLAQRMRIAAPGFIRRNGLTKKTFRSCLVVMLGLTMLFAAVLPGGSVYAAAGDIRTIAGGKGLDTPNGIHVLPTGEILLADTFNHRVIKIDAAGAVTHIAGTGVRGYSGDGGPATSARLDGPMNLAVDRDGNLFIADVATSSGMFAPGIRRVRKVDTNGIITSIVSGASGSVGVDPCIRSSDDAYFNNTLTQVLVDPADASALAGRVYVIADGLWRLEESGTLTNWSDPVCGNGVLSPGFVTGTFGYYGTFYYWDASDFTVRATNDFQTSYDWDLLINNSPMVSLHAAESGDLFVASPKENRVYRFLSNYSATLVIAGTGTAGYSGDGGRATDAELNGPAAVFQDHNSLDLYIVDRGNNGIRKVGIDLNISTVAGTVEAGPRVPAKSALLRSPRGVASDSAGNVYVADTYNHMVRKIDPAGFATTIAGIGHGDYCGDGGPAATACLFYPKGVYADPAGNVYIADTMNDRIRKVDTGGIITTVTGTGYSGFSDGLPAEAVLNAPSGVAVKSTGELFFADTANNYIRFIDILFGNVMTFWSVQLPQGLYMSQSDLLFWTSRVDGAWSANGPIPSCSDATGIAADHQGNTMMACPSAQVVQKSLYGAPAVTIAGTGMAGYAGDGGPAINALLAAPGGVSVDPSSVVYIADSGNDRVRAIESGWMDMTPPGTAASPAGGVYELPQTVTLTCGDGLGSGCQATFYCLGAGCTPGEMYSPGFPIQVPLPGVLRMSSRDLVGNNEPVREEVYSVPGPPGWRIHSVSPAAPSIIDWYAGLHAELAPGSYVKIGGTYYFVEGSGRGSWSHPFAFNMASLKTCDQFTGMPLVTPPDMSGAVGQLIEHFATWPVLPPPDTTPPSGTITINNGAQFTNTASVTLTLSCVDAGSGCSQLQVSNGGEPFGDPIALVSSMTWTLSEDVDGPRMVMARFGDAANNWSEPVPANIMMDRMPPSGFLSINMTDWQRTLVDGSGVEDGMLVSSAVDTVGAVHMSYIHHDGSTRKLSYATNASGQWQSTLVDVTGEVNGNAMALDALGHAHIAYTGGLFDLKYTTNASGTWQTITLASSGDVGRDPAIAIDANGKVHIAYYENNGWGIMKYTTNAGGSWSTSVVYSPFTVGAGDPTRGAAIVVDQSGTVHLCFVADSTLSYATRPSSGGVWNITTLDASASYPALAIDQLGTLHLVYTQFGLIYRTKSGSTWSHEPLFVDAGYGSIVLDQKNKVHISFTTKNGGRIGYANKASGDWLVYPDIDGGEFSSIAIGGNGIVGIAYSGPEADLKYASLVNGALSGALLTTSGAVELHVAASDSNGIVQMQFSNDYGLTYADPVPYAKTASWQLAAGEGNKVVLARFQDTAGNWSRPYTDIIYSGIPDMTPNPFAFTDKTGQSLSTLVTSNSITVSGLMTPSPISITGGWYEINAGGTWTSAAGYVSNGDSVRVQLRSSGAYSTTKNAILTIGNVSDTFSVTTIADTVPDPFTFTEQTNVPLGALVTSNSVTITGLASAATATITGATGRAFQINGGAWSATSRPVSNGNTVRVRHAASSQYGTATETVLTIGGVSGTFRATTAQDTTPDPFVFQDQTNIPVSTLVVSNSVTVKGITTAVPISITGGEYDVNAANLWTTATGTVNVGDTVRVRQTSAAMKNRTTNTVLTIGGGSDTFSVSTPDTWPNAFAFTDQAGVPVSTLITSNSITVSGITEPVTISVSNGEYEINNSGLWLNTPSTSNNGDTVRVRVMSSSDYSWTTGATLTIGIKSDTFSATTIQASLLSVNKSGTGSGVVTSQPAGISCGADCDKLFAAGTVVILTATPVAGSAFSGWSGDPDCVDGIVTTNAAKSCTATFSLIPPVSSVTLSASPASPQLVDTQATFTATASGGTGSYQYKFRRRAPGSASYTMVQDYSTSNTMSWDTTDVLPGTYTIQVYARNAGSTAAVEASKTLSYSLVVDPPVAGVTLTGDPHGSQTVGSTATFTAVATGGTGTYEYKFLRRAPGSTVFIMAQDYSTSNILTWDTTGYATGAYGVQVRVRSRFSPASVEKSRTIPYTLK